MVLVGPYPSTHTLAFGAFLNRKVGTWVRRGRVFWRRLLGVHSFLLHGGDDVRKFVPCAAIEHTTGSGFAEAV
jgi:hypothetical protein